MTSTATAQPAEPTPSGRRRRFAVPLVFGIVIAVLGAIALVLHAAAATKAPGPVAAPPGVPTPRTTVRHIISCVAPPDAAMYCQRLVAEAWRRTTLTDREYATAQQAALKVWQALAPLLSTGAGHCQPAAQTRPPAPCRWIPDAPSTLEVPQVRRALLAAGFTGVTVRLAAPSDPAPAGAVLYAVPAGNACVLGYHENQLGFGGNQFVTGRLSDGSCLTA